MNKNLQLKNECLKLQKSFLIQESEAKSEINKLTIENLKLPTYNVKLDAEIKKLTVEKLKGNVADGHP